MKQINFKSLVAVVLLASTTVICTASATSNTEKWEIKTSSEKIPEGWEPFGYDSNDKSDPFLLRRKTNNWDNKQKWEIKTSSGAIPEGWEPFAYDSNDKFDPFLLRRRTSGNWDNKQKWEIRHLPEEGLLRAGNHLLMTATTSLIRFSCAVAQLTTGIISKSGKYRHPQV